MPRKHMNDIERAKAIAWSQERVSQADIAKRLKVGKRTIERLIDSIKKGLKNLFQEERKGLVGQRKLQRVK